MMPTSRKLILMACALATCVGLDQVSKRQAVLWLQGREPLSFLGDVFRLEYAENKGAFLGLGATLDDWPRFLLLIAASLVILVGLLVYILARKDLRPAEVWGFTFIVAGGFGNMIDRIHVGFVVDFMNVGIGPLRTGIFNVADLAIMAGLVVVVVQQWQAAGKARPGQPKAPASGVSPRI